MSIFFANLNSFCPGDVMLTRHGTSLVSKGIRMVDGGEFSHAMICVQAPTFLEAIGQCVSSISLGRCYVNHLKNIRVLRYRNKAIAAKAARIVTNRFGEVYSIPRALASVMPFIPVDVNLSPGVFCSALVAQAYKLAEAPEFNEFEPMKTTPRVLGGMSCFEDVTETCFSTKSEYGCLSEMSVLDGDRIQSNESLILKSHFDEIMPMIENLRRDFPRLPDPCLKSFFMVMDFVGCYLLVGRDQGWSADLMDRIRQIDLKSFHLLSDGKLESYRNGIFQCDETAYQKWLSAAYGPETRSIDQEGLLALQEITENQIVNRGAALASRLKSIPSNVSCVRDKWSEIEGVAIAKLQLRSVVIKEILSRV